MPLLTSRKKQFLAHVQARINDSLNDYAVSRSDDLLNNATSLGVSTSLFARTKGGAMNAIFLDRTQILTFEHRTFADGNSDDVVDADDRNRCKYDRK